MKNSAKIKKVGGKNIMENNEILNAINLLIKYSDKKETAGDITLDEARIIEEALDILAVCVEDENIASGLYEYESAVL